MRFLKPILSRVVFAALLSFSGLLGAQAAVFTFSSADAGQSVFVNDNEVRLLPFTVTDSFARLEIATDGYAALGGFDPTFAVYTSTGAAAADRLVLGSLGADISNATGLYDDVVSVIVPAGNYLLALTQYDNTPTESDNDPQGILTRADGFIYNNPNFADPNYTGGPFVNLDGVVRNGQWRTTVVTVAVPETSTVTLALPGLLALVGIVARRRNLVKGN